MLLPNHENLWQKEKPIYRAEKCQLEHPDGRERGHPRQIWFWQIDADARDFRAGQAM